MSETRPNLKKYTKDELIWLVEHICYVSDPFGGRWRILQDALADLDHRRRLAKIDEADEHARKASAAREKAAELMKKHEGKRFIDIDQKDLEKISAYMKEAQREDEAFLRKIKEVG